MRRLALAAFTVLALAASTVLLFGVGGGQAQPTGIDLAGERPPSLLPLELLGLLQPPPTTPPESTIRTPPDLCFGKSHGGACARVCTRFLTSARCDRFSSPTEGCLRFVKSKRSSCLRPAPPPDHPSPGFASRAIDGR